MKRKPSSRVSRRQEMRVEEMAGGAEGRWRMVEAHLLELRLLLVLVLLSLLGLTLERLGCKLQEEDKMEREESALDHLEVEREASGP